MARMSLWLRSVLNRRRLEREMQAEMSEHLERSTDRLTARGMSRDDARREAQREFGNVAYLQEEGRIARGTGWVDALLADTRFAVRQFGRKPLSTATILVVLTLGIGINSVLFTMRHSYATRPPPGLVLSDDLVRIRGTTSRSGEWEERTFSLPEVEAYATLDRVFSRVAAWTSQPMPAALPGNEDATLTATFVTDDYFRILGVQPLFGPGLPRSDAAAPSVEVALISHGLWSRSFASDPGVVGQVVTLEHRPFAVVGVMPEGFVGAIWAATEQPQVWVPLAARRILVPEAEPEAELFRLVARLQPGVDAGTATNAVEVVAASRAADDDERGPAGTTSADVVQLLGENNSPRFERDVRFMAVVFGGLGLLILLVTCTNVSALQAGLALARRREIAIRLSLGASRRRVVRQLVTEGVLLASLAAAASVALTAASLRVIPLIFLGEDEGYALAWPAISFTFGIAIGAGILFGLSPALHATRMALSGALKDSAASVAGARARLQRGLVVAQIAFTQPLAVCVAAFLVLLAFEFREETSNPFGEQIVHVQLATANGSGTADAADLEALARHRAEIDGAIRRLEESPGIESAIHYPNRRRYDEAPFLEIGNPASVGQIETPAYLNGQAVPPGYLDLIGYPLVLGRDLVAGDSAARADGSGSALPAVIGSDMARALWPSANPIGRQLVSETAAGDRTTIEVVGVYEAPIVRGGDPDFPFETYVPPDPAWPIRSGIDLLVRTAGDAEPLMPTIREVVREELPREALISMGTLASIEEAGRVELYGAAALIVTGGAIALFLAALGLYAVVSFAIGQRTREIAVRIAIGAKGRQIVRHFARDGMQLSVIGMLIGLPLSIFGLGLILEVSEDAPDINLAMVMAIVGVGVLLVAGIATWIPSSRAAGVDPAATLRRD